MNVTTIGWTHYTTNPIRARNIASGAEGHFCEKVSPGCENCYASTWNEKRYGTGLAFDVRNRPKVEMWLNERELQEWQKPKYAGKRVFVEDMSDLFGEWVSDEWLAIVFGAMLAAPGVTFQLLTKRPERLRSFLSEVQPLPNVWLGVSVEDQERCWPRVSALIAAPAAVRWVSYEPALGPVSFRGMMGRKYMTIDKSEPDVGGMKMSFEGIDWLVCGAESGAGRRPFDLAWARSVRDQCKEAGVAFWFKQAGAFRSETPSGDPDLDNCKEFPMQLAGARR